ncbi:hypothetical protein RHS04_03625 [Rhizoctonia solani]|uniref:BAG domain-containing protein n=2 Tax=Rhizoctonia solani TaxID=456999 RepID=A0A8H7HD89_9AGAM|nr:hypothetical protein RHS04_03625 [Rhizoctonia solani]
MSSLRHNAPSVLSPISSWHGPLILVDLHIPYLPISFTTMSTYKYAPAPGYLSPYSGVPCHSTHKDTNSYSYRRHDDANVKSYHSHSSHYARSTHSNETRSTSSRDVGPAVPALDPGVTYSRKAYSVHHTDTRSACSRDPEPAYSYEALSNHLENARPTYLPDAYSVYSTDTKSVHSTHVRSGHSTSGRSARSKSRTRIEPEPQPQQYLNVQAPVQHRRCSSATGSHRSRAAPSLTHSAPSTSDDDNESDAGRSVGGINTPFTAKVALWRDDVRDMCDEMPPETILPPHIKAQYEYSRRQCEASPSSKPVDIPRIVVPSYTAPSRASSRAPSQAPSRASSRASSPRSASPPTSLPSLPSAPVSDLEKIIENIEDIEYQINARVLEFTFPSILDFGERFPNGEFPPLPYTVRNKSLIEHRDYLEKSLLSMDEIQSFGDSRVKCTRKRVVTKIEEQLEQLNRMEKMVRDNMHYERWKKTPRIQVTAPPGST